MTGNVAATNYSRITWYVHKVPGPLRCRTLILLFQAVSGTHCETGRLPLMPTVCWLPVLLRRPSLAISGVTSAVQTQLNAKFGEQLQRQNQVAYGSGGSVLQGNSNFTYTTEQAPLLSLRIARRLEWNI